MAFHDPDEIQVPGEIQAPGEILVPVNFIPDVFKEWYNTRAELAAVMTSIEEMKQELKTAATPEKQAELQDLLETLEESKKCLEDNQTQQLSEIDDFPLWQRGPFPM